MVKKQINKRRIFIILLGIITVFAIYLVVRGDKPITTDSASSISQAPDEKITAEFTCGNNESIKAEFVNGENSYVNLSLSDGRTLTLPSAVSADGARYANTDESIVFWNVGDTATLQEDGVTTYDNCATSS